MRRDLRWSPRHLSLALFTLLTLLAACGGAPAEEPVAIATAGDEAPEGGLDASLDAERPLEDYLSPSHDYVAVDLDMLRAHPFASVALEAFATKVVAKMGNELQQAHVTALLARTQKVLLVGSLDVGENSFWVFFRGDFEGYYPTMDPEGREFRLGDHTLGVNQRGEPIPLVGDPGERLDSAIAFRVDVNDALRRTLEEGQFRSLAASAERLRGRVSLGEGLKLQFGFDLADEPSADRAVAEILGVLGALKPTIMAAPAPLPRIVNQILVTRQARRVVVDLSLTDDDVRQLWDLALSAAASSMFAGDAKLDASGP